MVELFEFEVCKKTPITESYIEQFIEEFLDSRSLYWGGGYSLNKMSGVISINEKEHSNIDSVINDFVGYFNEEDLIAIKRIED